MGYTGLRLRISGSHDRMIRDVIHTMLLLAYSLAGVACGGGSGPLPTRGEATIECDESVLPVFQQEVEDFHRNYKDARLTLRVAEAREAIANFVNDSVRVIVSAREFNTEEKAFIASAKIEYQAYKVALDAVAVIGHKSNPMKQFRTGELDSIFSGAITRWPGKAGGVIDIVIGGVNSSTNEVFRDSLLKGKSFAISATPIASSEELVKHVESTPAAVGIVGVNWLRGHEDKLTVFGLGDPSGRPDSTEPPGRYYPPIQAHIYRNYYPICRPVYIYSREVIRGVGLGFTSYVSSLQGQKIIQEHGLVPTTMPVRLVSLTSEQVIQ